MSDTQFGEVETDETVDENGPGASAGENPATEEAVTDVETDTESEDEDEGDVAADYIEELLDICDIDGDIDIDASGGRVYISVNASGDSNLGLLSKTDTVGALQELTRLAVQNRTGLFSRLILDIGGSREARRVELTELVDRAIEKIDAGAAQASLPPMSSYERKIVHDVVADRGYVSMSEGEGRDRHTVITPTS